MKESTTSPKRRLRPFQRVTNGRLKPIREAIRYPSPQLEKYVISSTFVDPSSMYVSLIGSDGYIFDVVSIEELLRNGYEHKDDYEIIVSDVDGLVAKIPRRTNK